MSRAKYVLTYTENTDAGDPASLTKNRFFCIKENAVAAMETAFIAVDNIMHFSDRTTDDMHYISRTETSIYVCDGIDTMSWAIEEIVAEDEARVREEPMSLAAAQKMQAEEGKGYGLVPITDPVGNDVDGVDDILVERPIEDSIPYTVIANVSLTMLSILKFFIQALLNPAKSISASILNLINWRAEKHDDKIERMDLYGFRLFAISPLAR